MKGTRLAGISLQCLSTSSSLSGCPSPQSRYWYNTEHAASSPLCEPSRRVPGEPSRAEHRSGTVRGISGQRNPPPPPRGQSRTNCSPGPQVQITVASASFAFGPDKHSRPGLRCARSLSKERGATTVTADAQAGWPSAAGADPGGGTGCGNRSQNSWSAIIGNLEGRRKA